VITTLEKLVWFSGKVNSRSRSLCAIARPSLCHLSVVCLSSVTFVRPTQAVQIFGNISTALGTLAIRLHPLKIKGKEEDLYSAFLAKEVHSKRSGMDHTVLPANNTMPAFPSWAFTGWHHHSNWGSRHPITAYYSFLDHERMKGWVGLVGWPIADGLPT